MTTIRQALKDNGITLDEFSENPMPYDHELTVFPHHGTFNGSSFEARVIIDFKLPDGRHIQCNDVRRFKLSVIEKS